MVSQVLQNFEGGRGLLIKRGSDRFRTFFWREGLGTRGEVNISGWG